MGKRNFDYIHHNRKIANLRGDSWKEALRLKKLEADLSPSALRIYRVTRGLSQRDIQQHMGINTVAIYARIERQDVTTTKERAGKISQILKKPVNVLFLEVEKNKFLAL